jgi:hypothetical protein
MGYATLGFKGNKGPKTIRFRIDPSTIDWGFNINTSVQDTVGGRVVQVLGATLSDITITGLLGEDHRRAAERGEREHPGRSWRLHKHFVSRIREMQEWQSRDANRHKRMHRPARFQYPPHNWDFMVYIKDLQDPDGGTVTMRSGKFSHGYNLVLFVVPSRSGALDMVSERDGTISKARQRAINEYIGRISQGIGWKPSIYNGNFGTYYEEMFPDIYGTEDEPKKGDKGKEDKNKDKLTPGQKAKLGDTRTTGAGMPGPQAVNPGPPQYGAGVGPGSAGVGD